LLLPSLLLYPQEANPKPDLKRPCASSTSLVCTGLSTQLGWSYEDLIAACLVDRLLQLEQAKPHMLAHFMPTGVTTEDLMQLLPERVVKVLTHGPDRPDSLVTSVGSGNLQEQLSLLAIRAFAGSFSAGDDDTPLPACESGGLALTRSTASCQLMALQGNTNLANPVVSV
jgi:hypothetical protein